ncbi:MAG: hypothetical protein KDC46_13505 [Thermoleophilia bacterium]|nr:hypothetical protein [Thermoleophilia bacterium]
MQIGNIEITRRDVFVGGGALAVGGIGAGVITGKLVSNAGNTALQQAVKTARIQGAIGGAVLGAGLVLGITALVNAVRD